MGKTSNKKSPVRGCLDSFKQSRKVLACKFANRCMENLNWKSRKLHKSIFRRGYQPLRAIGISFKHPKLQGYSISSRRRCGRTIALRVRFTASVQSKWAIAFYGQLRKSRQDWRAQNDISNKKAIGSGWL